MSPQQEVRVENCVAIETAVMSSLRENRNVSHNPENVTKTSVKCVSVRTSEVHKGPNLCL